MTTEERLLKLENAFNTLAELAAKSNERTSELEQSFVTLTQLAVSASERMDTQMGWINSLGAAQAELTQAQANTEKALASLTARVDQLSETVERYISGQRDS